MKASNKWLIGLGIVFFGVFLANIRYHHVMFEQKKTTLQPKAVFESQRDRITVVMLTDSTGKAGGKIEIKRPAKKNTSWMTCSETKDFERTFWQKNRYSHDTMYIDLGAVAWGNPSVQTPEVRFSMQRLEKVYYNGRLLKEF